MPHFLDGKADCADEAEVEKLVNELVSEIGETETRPEIVRLALELQALINERAGNPDRLSR